VPNGIFQGMAPVSDGREEPRPLAVAVRVGDGCLRGTPGESRNLREEPEGAMWPWQDLCHNRQGPVPSIDAPSAGLFLGGFRPRSARFRFTQRPEA
jgi:hypothetical protein